jgi:predicted enzyme related to lactoylglutathione lyase
VAGCGGGFLKQPECPEQAAIQPNGSGGAWDAYIGVDNADTMFAELRAKGAKTVRELCDTVYEEREFEWEDIDGYRLCIAHDISWQTGLHEG